MAGGLPQQCTTDGGACALGVRHAGEQTSEPGLMRRTACFAAAHWTRAEAAHNRGLAILWRVTGMRRAAFADARLFCVGAPVCLCVPNGQCVWGVVVTALAFPDCSPLPLSLAIRSIDHFSVVCIF